MKRTLLGLLVLGCLLALPSLAADKPRPNYPFDWPLLAGFRAETLAFPLDFAPSVHFRGLEEIRFCPGFSKPAAPDYFSYSFVWWIDADDLGPSDRKLARLQTALTGYFSGLMDAVKKKHAHSFPTTVEVKRSSRPEALYEARVKTWDAFFTGRPLDLQMTVYQPNLPPPPDGGVPGRTVLYFEVSPRLNQPDIRSLLTRVRKQLQPLGKS